MLVIHCILCSHHCCRQRVSYWVALNTIKHEPIFIIHSAGKLKQKIQQFSLLSPLGHILPYFKSFNHESTRNIIRDT